MPGERMQANSEPAYPLTDLSLARRLERAEAVANAAFVEARSRIEPAAGATWLDVDGVYAMFDGPDSPLTQTFGLGVFGEASDDSLERLEAFFVQRAAPVFHEVSPLAPSTLLGVLAERGYRPLEFSSVLVRPVQASAEPEAARIRVRVIGAADTELWSRVAGQGWSSESPELAAFVERFGRVITRARGTHCFLAELGGEPIAAAAMTVHGDVALLAGASTVPAGRRQGAQRALLDARLRFAAANGVQLAMMVAQPGSASQRNAQREGFRIAYTRLKWQLQSR